MLVKRNKARRLTEADGYAPTPAPDPGFAAPAGGCVALADAACDAGAYGCCGCVCHPPAASRARRSSSTSAGSMWWGGSAASAHEKSMEHGNDTAR